MLDEPALSRLSAASRRSARLRALLALLAAPWLMVAAPAGCLSDIALPECPNEDCAGNVAIAGHADSNSGDAGASPEGGRSGSRSPDAGAPDHVAGGSGRDPGEAGAPGDAGAPDAGTSAGGVSGTPGAFGGEAGIIYGPITPGAGECDNCRITPPQLANPCGDAAYVGSLGIDGGTPPYDWHVEATTGSWHIERKPNSTDGSQAQLVGTPSGPTQLTVTVVDGAELTRRQSYSLVPRSACYFAYVSPDVTGPKLTLRDPLLESDASANLARDTGVSDFQFSPDGRFLAYRYGQDADHPHGIHLSLLDLSNMQDQALVFDEETIDAYAWSPDSSVLAVALTLPSGGPSELTGVRPTSSATGTMIGSLTAVVATDPIESNLYWVGSSFVGFYSATTPDLIVPPARSSVFAASLGRDGFAAPQPIIGASYRPGIVVASTPAGLLVSSPSDKRSVFNLFAVDGSYAVNHRMNFVDPQMNFSAAVVGNALQVYRATDSQNVALSGSSAPDLDCPKLLTWASNRERIACVAHVSQTNASWGELRIFDLGDDATLAPTVVNGSCLKDADGVPFAGQCSDSEYDYDEASSVAQARLFSPSGDWLAFVVGSQSGTTAAGALYWANLTTSSMALSRRVTAPATAAGAPIALAFSPSERYLLHQNGGDLRAHLLSGGPVDLRIDTAVTGSPDSQCSDSFIGAPTRWCGGEYASPSLIWSPDRSAEVFAYRRLGQLVVVELSDNSFSTHELVAPACDDSCTGQFAFQPPLP